MKFLKSNNGKWLLSQKVENEKKKEKII